ACWRSILVYILALPGLSSKSIMRGRGYLSFFVILFSPRKSTQSRRPPSFFLTNRMGAPCGDCVELIKPAAKFSSKNLEAPSTRFVIMNKLVRVEGYILP